VITPKVLSGGVISTTTDTDESTGSVIGSAGEMILAYGTDVVRA
jgi:hypothetical protein